MGVNEQVTSGAVGKALLHIAAADVAIHSLGFVVEHLQHVRLYRVVGVDEGNVFTLGFGNAEVASHSGAKVVFGCQYAELGGTRMAYDCALQDGDAIIGAVIIDKKEFHFFKRLRQE